MKTGRSRWIKLVSLALLMAMVFLTAAPAMAASIWYEKVYITKNPDKMIYEIGESFDKTGIVVKGDVYNADGYYTTNTIGFPNYSFSPATFTKAGKQKVTMKFTLTGKSGSPEWFTLSLYVTVNEAGDGPTEWYTDIFVASQPKKTTYTVGESFKASGLSLSAHKFDSAQGKTVVEKKLSQKNMKVTPSKFTKTGSQTVTLSLSLLAENGEYKWFSTTVKVDVVKPEVKITKHPTGESIQEGGKCSFIARADNATSCHWFFTKGSENLDAKKAATTFPGLAISGITSEKLKLSNVPVSLDGWQVYCVFEGDDGYAVTKKAKINVAAAATEAPATEVPATEVPATEVPATEAPATTEVTPAPITPAPVTAVPSTKSPQEAVEALKPILSQKNEAAPGAGAHVHSFSGSFMSDDTQHWLQCACGERSSEGEHVITKWTTVTKATREKPGLRLGTCAVCGHLVEEDIPYVEIGLGGASGLAANPWMLVAIGAGVLALGMTIFALVMASKQKKSKKRHRKPEVEE